MHTPDPAALAASPEFIPVQLAAQPGAVEVVRLQEADYRAASFLDGRLAAQGFPAAVLAWDAVRAAAPPPRGCHFIFHIGHCGSTLLARLLGEHPALFSVREPGLLRELARGGLPARDLPALAGLYARVWRPEQTALVKATSFVADCAPSLMQACEGRALLLGVTPPAFLCGILGGARSREDIQAMAASRQVRLEQRLGRPCPAQGDGETIALAWLCESMALDAAAEAAPGRCLRLDFDAGLAQPADWVRTSLAHLCAPEGGLDVARLVQGPLMGSYSKAPEHAYDAGLRRAVLAEAAQTHAPTVRQGMDWLQRQARQDERVARALLASAQAARRSLAPPVAAG